MPGRVNLREYQQGLIERMRDPGRADARITTLGVEIAGKNWLVDMRDLGGVLPLPPLAVAPLARPWFLGAIQVRGTLYGVTDLAAYRREGKASGMPANRVLLTAGRHAFNAALLVERVLGLRGARAWAQDGEQAEYRDEQGNIWNRLDIAGLLGHPDFLRIGA